MRLLFNCMKWMCAVALVFAAQNVFAYGHKTVKDYVQDGLIAQFDAIANAGWSAEQGDIHNGSATTWTDIVSGTAAAKSGTITVNPTYLYFGKDVSSRYTISSTSIFNALKAKSMTVQIFVRPESYRKYAGYLAVGGGNSYRQLMLDQREDRTVCKDCAFGGLQYRNGSSWPGVAAACPTVSTKSYIGQDVLVNITIDSAGAHLSLNDGAVIHTNPGGSTAPSKNTVWLGCAGNQSSVKMRLYAMRFYSKVLSAEEIATNLAIDRERFLGVNVPTTVSCSATDSATELSTDGETWGANIVANDVVYPTAMNVRARNSEVAEGAYFVWSGLPSGATFADDLKSQVSFSSQKDDLAISCYTKKVAVSASATDGGTQLSLGSGAWAGSIDESIYAISNAIPDISVRNVYFEGAHFVWSGLPAGATVSGDYNSTVHFKDPPENLEIECHAARLDFSATASDEFTQLSLDGENWASSIQLPDVFATTNLTVYARNTSGSSHAFFTWGNLPTGAKVSGVDNSSVSLQIPLVETSYAITCSSMASDDLNIWTGGTGDFEDDTKWSLGEAPGATSIAIIPNKASAYTVTVNTAFNIAELILGGGDGSGYPTLSLSNGVKTNNVAGAVTVARGATLTHRINDNGSTQYKLCLKCDSMTIASGGKVHGDLKGPFYGATFGSWSGKLVAHPAYGGVGGRSDLLSSRHCWGSIREPMDLGGAGDAGNNQSYKAGGAVYLEVAGELVVNGTISVLSQSGYNYYNGTGGSIYLRVGSISGKGTIDASAGTVTSSAGAGGGRISIRQSTADSFSAFTGSIKAYGDSKSKSGCGTIYLEHAGDVYGEGTLLIDSGPTGPANYYCSAFMDSYVLDRNLTFGTVIVTNGAYLRLPSGANLKITKHLCTLKGNLRCEVGSSVVFEGSEDALIEGTNYIYALSCTTPGKTIRFGTGTANRTYIVPNGSLTLAGEEGNLVNLRSKTDDTQWQLSVGANANVSISYCDVKDSNATFGMMPLDKDGVDSGNNDGWSILKGAKPGDLIVWTGNASTSWTDASNWDPMMLPNDENRILIPAGCERYPLIAADTLVNSITNELGATITLSGGSLIVTNDFQSLGTMKFGVNDVLKFVGGGDQKVDLGNLSYSRITADKSGGSIEFLSGFKAQHFLARARTPVSFTFAAGDTVEAEHLSLVGLVGESGAYDHVLSIGSSGTWYLKTTGAQHVRGVVLSNCDASLGADLKLGAFSTDGLGNGPSCDFSPTAAAEWIGGGTSFLTASCWANEILPQAETHVCICPTQGTYTVSTSAATATGQLVIGGDGGTVNFTSNFKHDIAGGIYMLSGATCSFGYWAQPNEVTGDFLLARGATLTHDATTSGSKELYKLNFEVSGDATLEAGSSVNVQNKGFGGSVAGPGRTAGGTGGSAFAGVGSQDGNRPYGSILHPFSLGSIGYTSSSHGGGAFRLIAGGDVALNGSIIASSIVGNYAPGTGGSVWVSGASVIGKGSISVRAESKDSWGLTSSAGRIAIYQTERIGWSDFSMSIDTAGFSAGTYYREDGSGKGNLYIEQANNATAQTWIPMGDDALADYRKVSVIIGGGNSIAVTNRTWRAGSTLTLRDINLKASNARVYLKSSTIKVLSREHKGGRNWTAGSDYEALVKTGAIDTSGGGKIVWPAGMILSIR